MTVIGIRFNSDVSVRLWPDGLHVRNGRVVLRDLKSS
jgi:hypothetical protein